MFTPFARACKTYRLIEDGDRIAVCISGGKDSMLMAKLFQEIKRHRQVDFSLTFLVMDPGYNKDNRALIESNAEALGIPITIYPYTAVTDKQREAMKQANVDYVYQSIFEITNNCLLKLL